jgi:NhaP-type Na+/H+ or K+/H+ antiporter/mannitol/fructose-specific phosphotransferase system IIA component (Ntr-type)
MPIFAAINEYHDGMVTLCLAVGAGFILTTLSRRLQLPTIVLLLIGGFLLGPEVAGLIQPETLGDFFTVIVSLAIGIILYEGGLTLNLREFTRSSTMIQRLLTLGVLVTWLGTAALIWVTFQLSVSYSLLAASLVVVTGPTVIVPLLKRIQATLKVSTILHWEGVLIDAIGVFLALLCFEWVIGNQGGQAIANFGLRVIIGLAVGALGGWLIQASLKKRLIPENLINGYVLAGGVLIFGLTESFLTEAGLLAVTVAGLVIGWKQPVELKEIRAFKAEITDLLIGLLFILLVSRLEIQQFIDFGWRGAILVGLVMLLVRPLSVFLCSLGTDLKLREKVFLSWVAPRGVVAASMASLFAISLSGQGDNSAAVFLETFTYSVICGTVLIQGFSAGFVAHLLKLRRPEAINWLIVGANIFGRQLGKIIQAEAKTEVFFIDSNSRNVAKAREEGFDAYHEDALDADNLVLRERFQTVGHLIALTDNIELNQLLGKHWQSYVGRYKTHAWRPVTTANVNKPGRGGAATSTTLEPIGSIFGDVARPSVVSGELERLESLIEVITVPETEGDKPPVIPGHALLVFTSNAVIPLAKDADVSKHLKAGNRIATLHRSRGFLRRALDEGAFVEPEADDLESLYQALVERAALLVPQLSVKETMEDLYAQQKAFPAFLGHGIAVPHVYSSQVPERICIFAKLEKPLPFMGQDEQIRIVFFIISPSGDSEGHLATLAEIARTCQQQENIASLESAETLNDVLRVV